MVLNATFNNISVILWQSVLLMEETGVPGECHRAVTNHWQTLSHNVVSSTPHLEQGWLYNEKTTQDQKDYQAYHGNDLIDLIYCVYCHFQQYFSYIMATSFSGGRSRSTRREPSTMGKQLVNFITCGCESSAPFFLPGANPRHIGDRLVRVVR
jgi:hypothetical protein